MAANQHNPLSKGRALWGAVPIALIVVCALPSYVQASILQADLSANADELLVNFEENEGSTGASSSSSRQPHETPGEPGDKSQDSPQHAFDLGSPNPGGSSSSSSSSGPSQGGSMSCVAAAVFSLGEDEPSTRLAICQSLSLPSPPGNDLLRPPQS